MLYTKMNHMHIGSQPIHHSTTKRGRQLHFTIQMQLNGLNRIKLSLVELTVLNTFSRGSARLSVRH